MAPIALETEDHSRDAQFNTAMHGKSAKSRGGFSSMLNKDRAAHKAASDEYWKHWDNKSAGTETAAIREVSDFRGCVFNSSADLTPGSQSGIRHSHQTLLQSCDRSLRVWLGGVLPLLSLRLRRRFPPSYSTTRALSRPPDGHA